LCIVIYYTTALKNVNTFKMDDRQLSENGEEIENWEDPKKLRILTLGGSVTWGAGIDERTNAYPFLLAIDHDHIVTNVGIRATGSDYPAQCISSMLRNKEADESSPYDPDEPFDVITFEFSINGMQGFPLLIERLRERYPDALFIYIDMFSLMTPNGAFDSRESRELVKKHGGLVYRFGNTGDATAEFNFREDIDRSNPTEEVRKLFANDKHHASSDGHRVTSEKIIEIIDSHEYPSDPKLGSWLGGDSCTSWYENGETPLQIVEGGEMKEWDEKNHKFGIEVNQQDGLIVKYNHDGENEAALNLQYMTKAVYKADPYSSKYPPVLITTKQSEEEIREAKTEAKTDQSGLVRLDVLKVVENAKGWAYLTGLHNKRAMWPFHVTEVSNVGSVKPGLNFIYIFPLEERPNPFRVTATIVCEACTKLGWTDDIFWQKSSWL